jgi:hypothetical protein
MEYNDVKKELRELKAQRKALANRFAFIVDKQIKLKEEQFILEIKLKEVSDKIIKFNKKK